MCEKAKSGTRADPVLLRSSRHLKFNFLNLRTSAVTSFDSTPSASATRQEEGIEIKWNSNSTASVS